MAAAAGCLAARRCLGGLMRCHQAANHANSHILRQPCTQLYYYAALKRPTTGPTLAPEWALAATSTRYLVDAAPAGRIDLFKLFYSSAGKRIRVVCARRRKPHCLQHQAVASPHISPHRCLAPDSAGVASWYLAAGGLPSSASSAATSSANLNARWHRLTLSATATQEPFLTGKLTNATFVLSGGGSALSVAEEGSSPAPLAKPSFLASSANGWWYAAVDNATYGVFISSSRLTKPGVCGCLQARGRGLPPPPLCCRLRPSLTRLSSAPPPVPAWQAS